MVVFPILNLWQDFISSNNNDDKNARAACNLIPEAQQYHSSSRMHFLQAENTNVNNWPLNVFYMSTSFQILTTLIKEPESSLDSEHY